ncbi:uncharacterized protein RJT20DRAFT_20 [Scheffersomyces xylosifermentans]|uniref:uncharacterized protein n=1 Tax=Scheffersomyces xylosifermentans TaxID=1304137 RepID=UPI00315DC18E
MDSPNPGYDMDPMGHEQLLARNSGLLQLLPSLAEGLFLTETPYNALLKHLEQESSNAFNLEVQELRKKVVALTDGGTNVAESKEGLIQIDEDKNIVLGLTFGTTFLEAMAIIAEEHECIQVDVRGKPEVKDKQELEGLIQEYLKTLKVPRELQKCFLKFTVNQRIASNGQKRRRTQMKEMDNTEKLVFTKELNDLEIRQMLYKVGLSYNNEGSLIRAGDIALDTDDSYKKFTEPRIQQLREKLVPNATTTEHHMVDLRNWYCDCNEYQECYGHDEGRILDVESLLASYSGPNPVMNLFTECPSRILDPVPICCHLLTIVIIACNGGVLGKRWRLV